MTASLARVDADAVVTELSDVPVTPVEHFKLAIFGVIARLLDVCADTDDNAAIAAHPFLSEYAEEIEARTRAGSCFETRWRAALDVWVDQATSIGANLPLVALGRTGVTDLEIELLLAIGLIEEDSRFGAVFARAQEGEQRPTLGTLIAWWRHDDEGGDRADDVRRAVQSLMRHGLVDVPNSLAPRPAWTPTVTIAVWDALRGDAPSLPWLDWRARESLPTPESYVAPGATRQACATLPEVLSSRRAGIVVIRGPTHNGRKTLAAVTARALGKSLLIARGAPFEDEARWRLLGAIAAISDALPVVDVELAAGERLVLPPLALADTPLFLVTGRHGAIVGAAVC